MIFYQLLHYPVWQFLNFKSDPLFTSPVVERGCVASSSVVLAGAAGMQTCLADWDINERLEKKS